MQLYELKSGDLFKLLEDPKIPPDARAGEVGLVYRYTHTDGMYCPCYDVNSNRYYFAAWTEVEVVK
jgi:hypothetical protein